MTNESFKLTSLSEKDQIKKFGEVVITPDTEFELSSYQSDYCLACEITEYPKTTLKKEWFVHPFANYHGYSDVHPYEVVKYNTALKMTVREMDAELDPDWKPEIIPGGFAGHCVNQRTQTYTYTSNEENREIEIRYSKKNRIWQDKHGRRFIVSRRAYKFYDYNF